MSRSIFTMNSPFSPPSMSSDPGLKPISGYLARMASAIFATLFALLVLRTLLRLRLVVVGHPEAENVIGIVIGAGIWLPGLAAITAYFWRLSNHFLHPSTHGFGVLERQNAREVVCTHSDLDLAAVALPDKTYGGLSLRELLRVYSLMDHAKNPERLTALVATMQSHLTDQSDENSAQYPPKS
jgi:hypothetical protein